MKTMNIVKSFVLMAVAVMFAACEEELGNQGGTDIVPNFPELIEDYAVEPGSTQEIVFTPNLDWKVSIPSEIRQWFWIKDGSFTAVELTGEASTEQVSVFIGVTPNAEFDKNHTCEVTLEMGDSSKVVAKYMLPAKNKTLQVYAAKPSADGGFEMAADSVSYVYEEAAKLELIWSAADAEFRLPIQVEANCEWSVVLPEWAEMNIPETTYGVVDLVLKGESIEAATEKVIFKSGDSVLLELDASIPSCAGIEVYSAKMSDGEYEYVDGGYAWTEAPVKEVALAWLGSDFRVPVKVNAKCNWTVELPDWLTVELPEKTAGEVTVTILGEPSLYPLDATTGKIVFKNGRETIGEIKVNFPGCKDIMTFSLAMNLTSLEFNHKGELKTSTGYIQESASGHLLSSSKARIMPVETTGNKLAADPSWLIVEIDQWNTASGSGVLQEREVRFSVSENEGERRTAVIFILPPSVTASSEELFNEDLTVKEEYSAYAVPVVQVSEAEMEYIQIDEVKDADYPCYFVNASEEKAAELTGLFGETEYVYTLTYVSPYSRDNAYMTMLSEYSYYKVYAAGDTETDMSADETFWLQFSNGIQENRSGIVDMYNDMDLPIAPSVAYLVFYDSANNALGIVECVSPYEPENLEIDETSLIFATGASSKSINVTSNVAWTVTSNADWCAVAPESGSRNGVVTVSVTENDSDQVRMAELVIKSENITHVVTVNQKYGEVLEVDVEDLSFDCLSESKSIKIVSNVDWEITSSQAWCTVTPSSGSMEESVEVTVARNVEDSEREAIITLKSESYTKTIKVTQMYDDGSRTNGDDAVHFLDWNEAKKAGAILERLTTGEIYRKYRSGSTPVYHLIYEKTTKPLRIVLPAEVGSHNVNPYTLRTNFLVNGVVYDDEYLDHPEKVVLDSSNSVEISMSLPSDKTSIRGNINFIEAEGEGLVLILVCTLE